MENTAQGEHEEMEMVIVNLATIGFGLPLCLSREFTP